MLYTVYFTSGNFDLLIVLLMKLYEKKE